MFSRKFLIRVFLLAMVIMPNNTCFARDFIRSFGDVTQYVNPLFAGAIATQQKGFGHFAVVYGTCMISTWSTQYIGKKTKWSLSKRPNKLNLDGTLSKTYNGMPSGHTASAWAGAAYLRRFSHDYAYLSIPLYIAAGITAYSRVRAKAHTPLQVFTAIGLVEAVTYLNSKLSWSNDYCATVFSFNGSGGTAGFSLKF